GVDYRLDGPGLRREAACLLLRARDRNPHATLDRLRREAFRRAAAARHAHDHHRACLYVANLVHPMKLLKEPLLHFLLLGAVIVGAYGLLSKRATTEPGKIIVTQGRIEALATAFHRTWQRPPTTNELDGLIRDYIREEVATREAIALGLEKDDTIIRRRLR